MVAYVRSDLDFILQQILIAEADPTGANPAAEVPHFTLPFGLRQVDGANNNLLPGNEDFGAADTLFPRIVPAQYLNDADGDTMNLGPGGIVINNDYGLPGDVADADPRTISNLIVDMTINNPAAVIAALTRAGSADPEADAVILLAAHMTQAEADVNLITATTNRDLAQDVLQAAVDAFDVLIPATVIALGEASTAFTNATTAFNDATAAAADPDQFFLDTAASLGLELSGTTLVIPNRATDEGLSAQFNSWFTFFGQFFDHGLDLITKGGNGTVYVPLLPDDPLITHGPDGIAGTGDEVTNPAMQFIPLTRATTTIVDGVAQHENTTTSWVDQNQTYTSHPSHQVFLREYTLNGALRPVATGKLLDAGPDGGIASWTQIKAQALAMLGIELTDHDIHNVPLLRTDVYGKFIPDPATGFAQVILGAGFDGELNTSDDLVAVGSPGAPVDLVAVGALRTNHAFLNDIAHHAAPGFVDFNHDGIMNGPDILQVADADIDVNGNGVYDAGIDVLTDVNGDGNITTADFYAADFAVPGVPGPQNGFTYDDEMLGAHKVTGDGRGNENIALTTVHHVFHSEHNNLVEHTKQVAVESALAIAAEIGGAAGETAGLAFLNNWLDGATPALALPPDASQASLDALVWNGERLFQAAKFGTEMQYQHLVFEEFARKVQPLVNLFGPYNAEIDPSIVAEFAHVVYRFGHSMLAEDVARMNPDGTTSDVGLIDAFLNPIMFDAGGTADVSAGAIIRGSTRQVGNEIDEFIVDALRNNLLGLPLDLAVFNIARARDTGAPSLNEARAQFYAGTGDEQLKPYESWVDFALHAKNELSVVNFIAAYGKHDALTAADVDTLVEKRAVATALVFGGTVVLNAGTPDERVFDADAVGVNRFDFLNSTGIWTAANSGLNDIDLWIGGLAEAQQPFGGLLGSTFNFVFETQMENLQDSDRFYYLNRLAGTHFLTELEGNSFAQMVINNTNLGEDGMHLPGDIFSVPNFILEVDQSKQVTGIVTGVGLEGREDPTGGSGFNPLVIRDDPNTPGLDTNYLKFTGGEHVVLGGTNANDILISSIGDDTVWGDDGNDRIEGGAGVDQLLGGAGDDIITDINGDDNIKGQGGNDVINSGDGFDLILAGDGNDFTVGGEDANETFGGEGNDYIYAGDDADVVFGDAGDDWIEGGNGNDLLQGDFGAPFQDSAHVGNDVIIGGGGGDDYDSESGDDIMLADDGIERNEGMLGYDWVTYKNDARAANADMFFTGLLPPDLDAIRDRFDLVEGLSGWDFNDILRGDNSTTLELTTVDVPSGQDHVLRNFDLIDGLKTGLNPLFAAGAGPFSGGNIILGGGGSDIIEGRGGDDIIDGDAKLNVRLRIHQNSDGTGPEIGTADGMTTPITSTDLALNGKSLVELMFNKTLTPGQLSIVREIVTDNTSGVDIAQYSDVQANYTVSAPDVDGFVTVTHTVGGVPGADGTDRVRNIELLQFTDGIQILDPNLVNSAAQGSLAITVNTPPDVNVGDTLTVNLGTVTDADNPGGVVNLSAITLTWQVEQTLGLGDWVTIQDPLTETPVTGPSFTPNEAHELSGLRLRVMGIFIDAHGVPEVVTSPATVPVEASGLPGGLPPILGVDPIFGPIDEDTATPFVITQAMLLQNAVDPEGAPLVAETLALVDPLVGTLTDLGGGEWSFLPAANFNGHVDLTYTISDGVNVEPAEAVLDINPVVDEPIGVADILAAVENTQITFAEADLIGNDIDLDGDGLELLSVTSGVGGTVVLNADRSVTFTPTPGFIGAADFTYVVTNGVIDSLPVSVTVNVQDINNNPTGMTLNGGLSGTVSENDAGAIIGPIVVFDPDAGDTHTFVISDARFEVVGGNLKLLDGISLDFEADPQVNFQIQVFDQDGLPSTNNPYNITVNVTDVNEAPVINSSPAFNVAENTTFVGLLTVNDPDGPPSNFTITGGADAGLFQISPDGKVLLFNGIPDFEGAHGNSYQVEVTGNDGTNASAPQMITVNVTNQSTHLVGDGSANSLSAGSVSPVEEALIEGLGGNDTMFGGTGLDTMIGGEGNDYYNVGAGDQVTEEIDGGADFVSSSTTSLNLVDYANVEHLQTYGNGSGINLTGSSGNNAIYSEQNIEANILTGLGGNDSYIVGNGDTIVEGADQGFDWVSSSTISLDLADYANVEALNTFGSKSGINLTGNNANNTLHAENNSQANVLTGLGGNDFYIVGASDTIVETATGGTDWVASASIDLDLVNYANVENIRLRSAGPQNATGSGSANVIIGGAGANVIAGGGGNDILTGGLGADTFVMNAVLNAVTNVDRITDFTQADDTIWLENTGAGLFNGLTTTGTLDATAFTTGTAAADGDDRIIYNTLTGDLFYDSDGTGASAAQLFARLNPGTALANDDFSVV